MTASEVLVDGGGVFPDHPLPPGTRIRFRLDEDPEHDVAAFVVDGRLHVMGHYAPIVYERVQPNHLVAQVAW